MKKIVLFLVMILFSCLNVQANEQDVMAVFDRFVLSANAYSPNMATYYAPNARILRVVNKKDGGRQTVTIPFDRYLKELKNNAVLAKTVKYKNRYENRKIEKIKNDYKISAIRIPRNDKDGVPCHFVFTKIGDAWKIKEESMTTNVQAFLNAK